MHGGKFHGSSQGQRRAPREPQLAGGWGDAAGRHRRPLKMLSCEHLAVTNVGNTEREVKWLADTIQYSRLCVLVSSLLHFCECSEQLCIINSSCPGCFPTQPGTSRS